MAMNYKATPQQWTDAGVFASDTRACLLELRARVEALEAAANSSAGLTSSAPSVSLVDRMADAIVEEATSAGIVNDRPARAAIREVAAWLRSEYPQREGFGTAWANLIEQEADR